eukprot:gene1605-2005_t
MAKPASIKIRLNSSAGTGFFYVTKKNARTKTEKLRMNKYDPVVRALWISRARFLVCDVKGQRNLARLHV